MPRIMLVVTQSTNVIHLQGQTWRETPVYISHCVSSAYGIKVKPKAVTQNKFKSKFRVCLI